MELTDKIKAELAEQAKAEDAKEAELDAKMREWHESPEYKKMKADSLKKAGDGKGA